MAHCIFHRSSRAEAGWGRRQRRRLSTQPWLASSWQTTRVEQNFEKNMEKSFQGQTTVKVNRQNLIQISTLFVTLEMLASHKIQS
jgi:hypothetical protein